MGETGFISDIQHFSIGDGEGIRTTVFLQGCNLHCKWCHNPENIPREGTILRYQNAACNQKEKISGRKMTVEEVMKKILEDVHFYEESGGGVTLSGGEPLLQSEFCLLLCQRCAENHISVMIDTAGDVPFAYFLTMLPFVKTFLYDLKAATKEEYRKLTGGDFERITENLEKLITEGADVIVRIPVIPGHNDTCAYMQKYVGVLKRVGAGMVNLLPFHRLGAAKYEAMGLHYAYEKILPKKPADLIPLREIFEENGIRATIEE